MLKQRARIIVRGFPTAEARGIVVAIGVAVLLVFVFLGHHAGSSSRATSAHYPTSPSSRVAVRLGSRGSAIIDGTTYSVLGFQLLSSIPGSGVTLARNQEFAVVKVRLHNAHTRPTRASLGFLSLAAGDADYLPRIDVAARLERTSWKALYLLRLAPRSIFHAKVFFIIPTNVSPAIALRVGSHRTRAKSSLIPLFLP